MGHCDGVVRCQKGSNINVPARWRTHQAGSSTPARQAARAALNVGLHKARRRTHRADADLAATHSRRVRNAAEQNKPRRQMGKSDTTAPGQRWAHEGPSPTSTGTQTTQERQGPDTTPERHRWTRRQGTRPTCNDQQPTPHEARHRHRGHRAATTRKVSHMTTPPTMRQHQRTPPKPTSTPK